jgi:hypothetical protein
MRRFEQQHGALPQQLLEFIQSEAQWDVRLCAWLLYLKRNSSSVPTPWPTYISTLPGPEDLTTLLSYTPSEQPILKISRCVAGHHVISCDHT